MRTNSLHSRFPAYSIGRLCCMTPMEEMRKPRPKRDPPVAMAALVPTFIVHLPKMAAERPPAAIYRINYVIIISI